MSSNNNSNNNPRSHAPLTSFQPASSLPRDHNAPPSNPSNPSIVQPRPRPLIRGAIGGSNTILVNSCQRGNPLLQHIRSIGWEYSDIIPDYIVGLSSCILFLSIRYHRLHPEYIHTRISKLFNMFNLRILLVLCDVNDHSFTIKELTKIAIINNLTLIIAWTPEEAGKYVETYKSFEHKPPDLIKERVGEDYLSQITNVLTQVKGVNKTDVVTLLTRYKSLKRVIKVAKDGGGEEVEGGLEMCPGFGEVKAKRLKEVFIQPFRVGETRTYKQRKTANTTNTSATGGKATHLLTKQTTTASEEEPTGSDRKRALDALEENFNTLTEQEQLQLAIQLSMHPPSP